MAQTYTRIAKRRIAGAYVSSVISIALVLLLIGISSFLVVNARKVADYFKESMMVSVLLKQDVTEKKAQSYVKQIETLPQVKSCRIVSREEGTAELKKMLGEDFLSVFVSSPVPVSVDVSLKADCVTKDSLAAVTALLTESSMVDEISYQQSLVEALNSNLAKISLVIAVFVALMLFVSYVLIGNMVRISIFNKRFTIHTMKLVGATRSFICSPFIVSAMVQGLISAAAALVAILVGLFVLKGSFPQLFEVFSIGSLIPVALTVIFSGVVICVVSTYFTVNKLIVMSRDELYY